jgi:hypothetical protein
LYNIYIKNINAIKGGAEVARILREILDYLSKEMKKEAPDDVAKMMLPDAFDALCSKFEVWKNIEYNYKFWCNFLTQCHIINLLIKNNKREKLIEQLENIKKDLGVCASSEDRDGIEAQYTLARADKALEYIKKGCDKDGT